MYYFFSGRLVKQQAWLLMVVVIMEIPNSAFNMIYVGGAVYFHKQSCYDTL